MSKTPYELRLNLLSMAKELLENEWYTKRDRIMEQFFHDRDRKQNTIMEVPEMPAFPNVDDIISTAEKFNGFIS